MYSGDMELVVVVEAAAALVVVGNTAPEDA